MSRCQEWAADGKERNQNACDPTARQQSGHASEDRKNQTLKKKLADQAEPGRAQCRANRNLTDSLQ
jgi:hypothetical protein